VLYKVNAEAEGEGVELAERFAIDGYPTFILTDADAETIERWWGFDTPAEFVATLEQAVADPTTIVEKKSRFDSSPTASDAAKLGRYHMTRGEQADAASYYERAIELGPPETGYEFELAEVGFSRLRAEQIELGEFRGMADRALASPHLEPDEIVQVASWMIDSLREDEPTAVASYIARGLEATVGQEDDESLARARRNLLIDEALLVKNDSALAVDLKREGLSEGWESDPDKLNGFAWWCFENETNLEEAESLARRGVELATDDDQKARILDTVAEIVNLRGDRESATALMRQALELEPDNTYYREQLDRFSGEGETVASSGAD
jgi:tetratricopeptide (TPR) repeat protein